MCEGGDVSRRIALVSLHTSPLDVPGTGDAGGMNVYLVGLAAALRGRGFEVELLTRDTGPGAAGGTDAHTADGVPVRFLRAGPRASVAKSDLPGLADHFGRSMAELPPFDLVHSHYWLSGLAALPVARGWAAPHVLGLHTVAALKNEQLALGDRPEPPARVRAEAELVRASDLTIAATTAERSAILRATDAPAARVAVVPPGVDTHLFRPGGERPLHRRSAQSMLLVLARLQPLKGVDLAIRALAAIAPEQRPRLVIAGGTSPGHDAYVSGLHGLVTALGLHDRVEFLPAQSREAAAGLMRDADLLLVPSHSETYGLVALEAAASGTPVVAGRTSGLVESVVDGVTGVLVGERTPEAWGRAIDDLLHDPRRLVTLGQSALRHGRTHSWAHTAEHLADHYERLLSQHRGSDRAQGEDG